MKISDLFVYESPDHPDMKLLREKYFLDEVVKGEKEEIQQFIALRSWVQTRWEIHGYDQISEKNNSLKILQAASEGKLFQCWYYATVFVQCATSLGFKARRIAIGIHPACIRPGNIGHIVAEIWSERLQKWIVMDAASNSHYECNGIPQGALEIHNTWVTHRLQDIKYIQGEPVPKMIAQYTPEQKAMQFVSGAYDWIDFYFQIHMELRNNWFSEEEFVEKENNPFRISWIDRYHPEYSRKVGKIIDRVLWTDDPKLFLE